EGAAFYFNKNMSNYVDYQIKLLDKYDFTIAAGITTDNVMSVGLVYQF
ncbi:porin, partial [Erwinia amylovora]